MNYISQINAFWTKVETEQSLKQTSKIVYLALLQLNNRHRWISIFPVGYGQVLSMTGIANVKTYYSAINELESQGYIIWMKGPNQYLPAKFIINKLYEDEIDVCAPDYEGDVF